MRYAIICLDRGFQKSELSAMYFDNSTAYYSGDSDTAKVYFCKNKANQELAAQELAKLYPGIMFASVLISDVAVTSPGEVTQMKLTDGGLIPA